MARAGVDPDGRWYDVTSPVRVLLADDQALVRTGFRMVLSSHDDLLVVGEAADGDEAVHRTRALDPDVVLMDVRMPRVDGVEATRRIAEQAPRSKVLILTTFDLDEYAFAGLRAGASGFLLKDVPPEQLVDAVRAVAAGDAVVAPRVTRQLLATFADQLPVDGIARRPDGHPALAELTPREREVLLEIAAGRSNREIAERLVLTEATVKTHVGRILGKLDLRDRVQVVVFAYRLGLVRP
jgi:DNA-binding NarL/FixJ family response regulator